MDYSKSSAGVKEKCSVDDRTGTDITFNHPTSTPAPTAQNEPGGLFGYILSRKKSTGSTVPNASSQGQSKTHATRMKYHKLANAGASNYLMDAMSDDSDDEEPITGRENAMSPPPIFDTPSADLSSGPSWIDRFQRGVDVESNSLKEKIVGKEEGWIGRAWRTVDDASRNATDWISNQAESTNTWDLSSLFPCVPSITWPFSKGNSFAAASNEGSTDQLNTLALLPKMASRASFATKRRNPYQAVIGRDTEYLLSSNTAYFWGLSGGNQFFTSWLSWIRNNTLKLMDASEEHGIVQKAMERPKSQPSEASVQAVKNLLYLVQNQANMPDASMLETQPTNSSVSSNSLEPLFQNNPLEGFPDIHAHPEGSALSIDNDEEVLPAFESNLSFDSYNSSYATSLQSSPVRASPVRASPDYSRDNKAEMALGTDGCTDNCVESGSHGSSSRNHAINAEMASRIAEGTLRAYRDLVLDEAAELHSALHYWTLRWERPFLGWLEAGPTVWLSEAGHSPYEAGRKVSQIQAVLARRCASIGEIQQHLWRASWTKGVADWGMLGTLTGGEWTTVVGGDGGMDDLGFSQRKTQGISSIQLFNHPSLVGSNVTNAPGGRIVIDQDAQVVWSIDAMRVVRDQLYRASSFGAKALPRAINWPREAQHFFGDKNEIVNSEESDLPVWADIYCEMDPARAAADSILVSSGDTRGTGQHIDTSNRISATSTVVTDLSKMSEEVADLLEAIETSLYQQRNRRLARLKPPSRLRRNWYVFAIGVPTAMYIGYKLTKEHGGFYLMNQVFKKVADIYREHVSIPLRSIYQELVKGRMDVTDRKARIDAIESLKRMIRSWLDENFPKMPTAEKEMRAEAMDISLIEQNMEESIKYIYEAPALVRMSMIEMQFIKKELLSALVAMDELMGSNEINMQVAAMTPAVILLVAVRRTFQWLFYSIFREGRSREDIYATVRQTILDIERLLVMRDNPPPPPESLEWGSHPRPQTQTRAGEHKNAQTLSADDLGMLLLHIHECRQIIWKNCRRFRGGLLRNLTEDLAELAGERGPVSLTQQLHIVNRMSRAYVFMKPRSTFITKL